MVGEEPAVAEHGNEPDEVFRERIHVVTWLARLTEHLDQRAHDDLLLAFGRKEQGGAHDGL